MAAAIAFFDVPIARYNKSISPSTTFQCGSGVVKITLHLIDVQVSRTKAMGVGGAGNTKIRFQALSK